MTDIPAHSDGRKLREYWAHGEGAAKVGGWGTPGSYERGVAELSKYLPPEEVHGYVANIYHQATGTWPGAHHAAERVAKNADGTPHPGAMVALQPDNPGDLLLALPGAETIGDLHLTLAYLGQAADLSDTDRAWVLGATGNVCESLLMDGLGTISGTAVFAPDRDGRRPVVALVDLPGLAMFRTALAAGLRAVLGDSRVPSAHDFTPHITLGYADDESAALQMVSAYDKVGAPVHFSQVIVVFAGDTIAYPLRPRSAALEDGEVVQVAKSALPGADPTEKMFTLAPWYVPDKLDAHTEWTDGDEIQKGLWSLVRRDDRRIRLQHVPQIVAGELLEQVCWPTEVTLPMHKADGGSEQVTFPAGTGFMGVRWEPWAWTLVKTGKITGLSMGGTSRRIAGLAPGDPVMVGKAAWDEESHPRASDGEFGHGEHPHLPHHVAASHAARSALPADRSSVGRRASTRALAEHDEHISNLRGLVDGGKDIGETQQRALDRADSDRALIPTSEPDVAGQHGDGQFIPGAQALSHLDTVMTAGQALLQEAKRRAADRDDGSKQKALDDYDAHNARVGELHAKITAADQAHKREHGAQTLGVTPEQFEALNGMEKLTGPAHALGLSTSEYRQQHGQAPHVADDRAELARLMQAGNQQYLDAYADAERRGRRTRRDAYLEVLADTRPMGAGSDGDRHDVRLGQFRLDDVPDGVSRQEHYQNLSREAQDSLAAAEDVYPSDWLSASKGKGTLTLGVAGRGYYSDTGGQLVLSPGKDTPAVDGAKPMDRVAIHELGHRMEEAVPGLKALEWAYVYTRTKPSDDGTRSNDTSLDEISGLPGEYARRDQFRNVYTGKQYGKGDGDSSWELFTTAAESMLAGSGYDDDGIRAWLLGVMATL